MAIGHVSVGESTIEIAQCDGRLGYVQLHSDGGNYSIIAVYLVQFHEMREDVTMYYNAARQCLELPDKYFGDTR